MSDIQPIGYAVLQDLLQYKETTLFTPESAAVMSRSAPQHYVALYSQDQLDAALQESSGGE